MEAVFLKLVNMSITASWLVLAVLILRLLLKNGPKYIRVILWGFVGLRLIFPFSVESIFSLIPNPEPLPEEFLYAATPQVNSGIPALNEAVNPIIAQSMTPNELASANPTQIWSFIFSQVWILGTILMLGYALVSFLILRHKVSASIRLDKNLRLCDHIESPFILGVFRPVIYLPSELDPKTADMVLAHEYAHIQRNDHWWKPLGFLLLCVYWFNPVLWLAYILLCRDIELACDEKVISNLENDEKKAYSSALLRCSVNRKLIAACPLAFGEVSVKTRIKSILNYKKPAFWMILIAVILCIVVAVCFLTDPLVMIDPLTLEDWGITVTASDPTSTGVTLAYDIPDNLDGKITIPSNQILLELKDGQWIDVLPIIPTEDVVWDFMKIIYPDYKADYQRVEWETIYGEVPPGQYRIKKTLWLYQDGMGYQKDFYVDFTIPEVDRIAPGIYLRAECLHMTPLNSHIPMEYDIPFSVEIGTGYRILSPNGAVIEENPDIAWGWCRLNESGENVAFSLRFLESEGKLSLSEDTLYQKLSDNYHLLLENQQLLLVQGQLRIYQEDSRTRDGETLWAIYRLIPEVADHPSDPTSIPTMEDVITSLLSRSGIVQLDLCHGTDLILGSYEGWGVRNDIQYARVLEDYTYREISESDYDIPDRGITLKFGHLGEICYLYFGEESNLMKMVYDGKTSYYEAVPKYAGAEAVGSRLRRWYDQAEYESILKLATSAFVDPALDSLQAAEEFCNTWYASHLQVSEDSMHLYSYVKCDVVIDMEATELARNRGELDENGYAFYVRVTFLPANDRGAAEYMAGNTQEYTGSDPDVPDGAFQYLNCGYILLTEHGWFGQIVGTGF